MKDYDEISYPFMEEKGMFTDYEILTDGLSSYISLLCSIAEEKAIDEFEIIKFESESY